jgi:hypothetical protein
MPSNRVRFWTLFHCSLLIYLGLSLLWTGTSQGQQVSGSITGYVLDPSKSGIPHATVTVTNVLTGVISTAQTDDSGLYLVPNLIPGKYSVSVVASGFQKFIRENVLLNVDTVSNVDAQMTMGSVSETVTVSAAPPLLNVQKTDVGAVLSATTVSSLPTIGRNITTLEILAPGVTQYSYQQGVSENPSNGFTAMPTVSSGDRTTTSWMGSPTRSLL